MLKYISVILIFGILVLACDNSERPKKPDNLISKNQMSELLYDLYVINAAKGVNRKALETNGVNPENYILKKHNIDSTQFAESNTYYTFETETYKAIVEKVKARLEKEKKTFEAIKDKENDSIKKRKDSIRELGKNRNKKIKKSLDSVGVKKKKPKGLLGKVDTLQ